MDLNLLYMVRSMESYGKKRL